MTSNYPPQDEVIDLRKYIRVLLDYKWWIIGATILFALIGFGLSLIIQREFEATAIAAITQARNELRFDPRIQTVTEAELNYQTFATLATSDAIVEDLFTTLDNLPADINTPQALRQQLEARVQSDLVLLTARTRDPVLSETIVNIWVEQFVFLANQVYSSQDEDQIQFFESQLAAADQDLSQVNQALVDFQSRNRESIYTNQLAALNNTQATLLQDQQSNQILLDDIRSLIEQFEAQSSNQPVSQALQYSVVLLQGRAFGETNPDGIPVSSIQVQISNEGEGGPTNRDYVQQLTALETVIEAQLQDLNQKIQAIEPQITDVQQKLQEVLTEKDDLVRSQTVVTETYTTLARKVEEARIASQDTSGQIRLASYGLANNEPVSPGSLLLIIVAAAVGFLVSVVLVLFFAWWRTPADEPTLDE